ncbi:helix-turn-helix domain-containing protein [Polynucleobacter sp.]
MRNMTKIKKINNEAFVGARIKAGLSCQDLAVKACFSVRQIEQIESGASDAFYGEKIKVAAAKKIAGILNIRDEDAFISDAQSDNDEDIKIGSSIEPVETITSPVAMDLSIAPSIALPSLNNLSQKFHWQPKTLALLILVIVGAIVFIDANPISFFKDGNGQAPTHEIPTAVAEPPEVDNQAAVLLTQPVVTQEAKSSLALAQAGLENCPVPDASLAIYKPELARKAADMVYVQAKDQQLVCVTDANGKSQNKVIESGSGASFYGKPPFKVLAADLSKVNIFFQGYKVGISSGKAVQLESADTPQPQNQN